MKNEVKFFEDYAIIIAKNGENIIVDKDKADYLASNYKWHIHPKNGEPTTNKNINNSSYRIKMKYIITDTFKEKKMIYYRNNNPLDNRISNFTYCNNKIVRMEDYAIISVTEKTKNKVDIFVDLDDVEKIEQYSWTLHPMGYLYRKENRKNKFLHNLIMNVDDRDKSIYVDHKDRNPANNRKANLRLCTNNQNAYNKGKMKKEGFTSIYKGVSWDSKKSCWRARIGYDKNEQELLGYYISEEAAANAYNQAALKYHGEFAVMNNLPPMSADEIIKSKSENKISKYTNLTGITYSKYSKKWIACFRQNNKYIHIGSFENEIDAAKAYNEYILENNIDRKLNKIDN